MFHIYKRVGPNQYQLRGGAWMPHDIEGIYLRLQTLEPDSEFVLVEGTIQIAPAQEKVA